LVLKILQSFLNANAVGGGIVVLRLLLDADCRLLLLLRLSLVLRLLLVVDG